jgi:acyl transferase domain-containing protein
MYRDGTGALCPGMSVAFTFPGESSVHVGMAADLHATDKAILDRHLRLAANVTGLPVRRFLLEGTAEQLARPDIGEPALFAIHLALTEIAGEEGLEPGLVAGYGLGEFAAAVAAGVLSAEDGMRLVVVRSRLLGAVRAGGDLAGARGALARRAAKVTFADARIPLASNAFGGLIRDAEAIRTALIAQAGAPVGWNECVHALLAGGASALLELGPAGGLARAARMVHADLPAKTAGSRAEIAAFLAPAAA